MIDPAPETPNLDAMSTSELAEFALRHRDGAAAHLLFPSPTPGRVNAVATLAKYATWKHHAKTERIAGCIEDAMAWERACDSLYRNLPDYARW
jgi:hypothetical protein